MTKQLIKPLIFKGYIEPDAHTPKFVITKKIKLDPIEVINTFFKVIFLSKE